MRSLTQKPNFFSKFFSHPMPLSEKTSALHLYLISYMRLVPPPPRKKKKTGFGYAWVWQIGAWC